MTSRFLRALVLAAVVSALALVARSNAAAAPHANFVVNSTGDQPDDNTGDGVCHTSVNTCTLRAAIEQANRTEGTHTIAFNIPGACPQTITPHFSLPAIARQVFIDGYSQPGSSKNTLAVGDNAVLCIELRGSGGLYSAGLEFSLASPYFDSSNSVAQGLVINGFDIGIELYSIFRGGSPSGIQILGNFIGTDVSGTTAPGNNTGIWVRGNRRNRIGGPDVGDRNLISGNHHNGVSIMHEIRGFSAEDNIVQNNYIGTDKSGTAALGNGDHGIYNEGIRAHILNNVISANRADGVRVNDQFCNDPYTLRAADVVIQGNLIGTTVNGGPNLLGNNGNGLAVYGAPTMTIGGTGGGQGNLIAFNGLDGIVMVTTVNSGYPQNPPVCLPVGNIIRGNSIYANTRLGIDLNQDGVTPNDTGDPDEGPNHLQNYPILTQVTSEGDTRIQGQLNSTPSTNFTLEFFSNFACDTLGYGEGEHSIGQTTTTTDASGNVTFDMTLPGSTTGQFVTATATDPDNNTSEFSNCVESQRPAPSTDLGVSKRGQVFSGGNSVTFILTVTNHGSTPASHARLRDRLAPTLEYQSASSSQDHCFFNPAHHAVRCYFGALDPGERVVVQIVALANSSGDIPNCARVRSDNPDPNAGNNRACVTVQR